ncbi:transposase [Dyadobacter sp. LJ53]|uniref:transposase n=1 Tax=Dyadobacter chenwenxiniae TaxID=2906456 RepID=UPI001F4725F7|nr:transposase [Dyadobacter chenwenxiniae]MCF0050842.1 transposase [Dyadobacter chenwenxiniae]
MSGPMHCILQEECFYHIYNRGNNTEKIFFQNRNYIHFLKRYDEYLSGYVDTYAYCLMPNHFHLLVRIKPLREFEVKAKGFPSKTDISKLSAGEIVSELFRRFFMSYAKSVNIQEGRSGSLFQKFFRRKLVDNDIYFSRMVYYIHHQLRHHGFDKLDYRTYEWSSYRRILEDRKSRLKKMELLEWFGGKIEFIKFHAQGLDEQVIEHLTIED